MTADRRAALLHRAAEVARPLIDATHPDHANAVARLREIEAGLRRQAQPLIEAVEASERITAADLAVTINAGLMD